MNRERCIRAGAGSNIVENANGGTIISGLLARWAIEVGVKEAFLNDWCNMCFGTVSNTKKIEDTLNQSGLDEVNGTVGTFRNTNTKVVCNIALVSQDEVGLEGENESRGNRSSSTGKEEAIINKDKKNKITFDETATIN
jgi:hypothetical protein